MTRYRPGGIKGRKVGKDSAKFIAGLFYLGASTASAILSSSNKSRPTRRKSYSYGSYARQNSQYEMSLRRAERERKKTEKRYARLKEQLQFENDVAEIERNNYLWAHIHSLTEDVITSDEINNLIAKCDSEQKSDVRDGFFNKVYPSDESAKKLAKVETERMIANAENELSEAKSRLDDELMINPEPTVISVRKVLKEEANRYFKGSWFWKRYKLRNEYISSQLESRFEKQYQEWLDKDNHKIEVLKSEVENASKSLERVYSNKEIYFQKKVDEILSKQIKQWEEERDVYYNELRSKLNHIINGDKDFVIPEINNSFSEKELKIDFFVDFVYDDKNKRVLVDLDLPEIEDMPIKKIVLTPTGKKSIRNKSQADIQFGYANCVLGLAVYVAGTIFNVSTKINHIEICGFTQRKNQNSEIAQDQYML